MKVLQLGMNGLTVKKIQAFHAISLTKQTFAGYKQNKGMKQTNPFRKDCIMCMCLKMSRAVGHWECKRYLFCNGSQVVVLVVNLF